MARLAARLDVSIMAEESVCTVQDALVLVQRGTEDVFAKTPKSGGTTNTKKIAGIAEAGGVRCLGGTALETSNGVVASLHAYCTIPNLVEETELFGPLWLADDIVQEPVKFRD